MSDGEAMGALLSGCRFTPDERGGYWRPKRAADYGVSTRMFYKQSELFVRHMRETHPEAFRSFLTALQFEEWTSFADLFSASFGMGVDEMWGQFLERIGAGPAHR